MRVVCDLDRKSTVGYCTMSNFGTTIGEVLGWDGKAYSLERIEFLKETVLNRMLALYEGEYEADDIKVFVKQEPHKQSKIDEGRFRLISAVSLVDTMIDRILLEPMQKQAVNVCLQTPIVAGLNIMGGGHYVMRTLIGEHEKYLSLDKSAWDWSVPGWMIDGITEVVSKLNVRSPDWWNKIYAMRNDLLFEKCVYRFSDNVVAKQEWRGVMKSGCYGTLIYNSIGQLLLEILAREVTGVDGPLPFVLGDDSISPYYEGCEEVLDYMSKLGFVVKKQVLSEPEFIGFYFKLKGFEPAYESKHQFRLQHLTRDPELAESTLRGYQVLYANRPDVLRSLHDLAIQFDVPEAIMSDRDLVKIIDGI